MNILGLGLLAYAGTQFYKRANRRAFTLNIFIPEDWYVVDEGMYHSSKSSKAIVILNKTAEETLAESQKFEGLKTSLPGKIIENENSYIYFLIDQKHNQGYVIGFKDMSLIEIAAFCATIRIPQ